MKLRELQSRVATALMTPLSGSDAIARRTVEGKNMRAEVESLIAPNDRLTSVERLEIYSRSYWFRILDSLWDDFPGLAAVIGARAFHRMARAYLTECPSQSYTMRNLGSRLPEWLAAHPEFTGQARDLALDMARLEWAHMEAYDGPEHKPLGPEDLLEPGPDLKIALQPYITLLALQYPVDDFRLHAAHCRAAEEHGVASNAVGGHKRRSLSRRFRGSRPEPVYIAVHRHQYSVYYRRLEPGEFQVLEGLRAGQSIAEALDAVVADAGAVERWFTVWSELGWLCLPPAGGEASG
jgi:hypothetical protein